MEQKDPIEDKFKSAFSGFEQEPPERVWNNVRAQLHPVPVPLSFWGRMMKFSGLLHLHPALFFTISGTAFVSLLTVVYVFAFGHQSIRGHAYAGLSRMSSGNVELFVVADKAMPWDSVTHYRSALIDHFGHFQFARVSQGRYLLRIAPEENSETAKTYAPCWYKGHERSDSADVVLVERKDVVVDVKLMKNGETVKR